MRVKYFFIIGIFIIALHSSKGLSQGIIDGKRSVDTIDNKYLFSVYYGKFREQLLRLDTLNLKDFIADTMIVRGYEDNDPVLYAESSMINTIILFFLQDNNNYQLMKMRDCNDFDDCFVVFEEDVVWIEDMWFIRIHEGYKLLGIYADSRKYLELFVSE